jgi:hypothetical protein
MECERWKVVNVTHSYYAFQQNHYSELVIADLDRSPGIVLLIYKKHSDVIDQKDLIELVVGGAGDTSSVYLNCSALGEETCIRGSITNS